MAETPIKLRIRGRRIHRQNIATNANNAAFRGLMSLSSFCRIFFERIFSLNSIRNLELLITVAVGYIGFVSEKCEERITVMQLIECSKRIFGTNKFIFYAVADGLFALLAKYKMV